MDWTDCVPMCIYFTTINEKYTNLRQSGESYMGGDRGKKGKGKSCNHIHIKNHYQKKYSTRKRFQKLKDRIANWKCRAGGHGNTRTRPFMIQVLSLVGCIQLNGKGAGNCRLDQSLPTFFFHFATNWQLHWLSQRNCADGEQTIIHIVSLLKFLWPELYLLHQQNQSKHFLLWHCSCEY